MSLYSQDVLAWFREGEARARPRATALPGQHVGWATVVEGRKGE